MQLSKIVCRRLSIIIVVTGLLLLGTACAAEPTPPVAPTSTPEPELSLDDLLSSMGDKLAAVSTATFQMIDESESGAEFFGTTLKTVQGEIRSPDGAKMLVDVESPSFGFVEIEIVAVGEQAYMKFSKDAPWLPLPLDQVPFNFGGIGAALSGLLPVIQNTAIVGQESVRGAESIRIDGDVVSEDMSDLITSVDPGHPITLTFWIDELEHILRQFRITGQLFNDDGPGTTRLVTMDINVPVDIQLPEIASEP